MKIGTKVAIGVGAVAVYLGVGHFVVQATKKDPEFASDPSWQKPGLLPVVVRLAIWPGLRAFMRSEAKKNGTAGGRLPVITTSRAVLPEHGKGPAIVYEGVRAPPATA